MVENLVKKFIKRLIRERWVEYFQKHHNNKLISCYLHNINQSKYVADNSKHFQYYFNNVSVKSACYVYK